MNVRNLYTVAIFFLLFLSLSCATPTREGRRIYIDGTMTSMSDKHPSNSRRAAFNPENIDQIESGMSPKRIERLFGAPDMSFTTQFGGKTDTPWQGLVYRYHMVPDPLYEKLNVFKSNTFIFADREGKYLLEEADIRFFQSK